MIINIREILIALFSIEHFTPYFEDTSVANCMNGTLYELFEKFNSTYMESPRVNMATLCSEITTMLRQKMVRDTRSNKFKNEIVHILSATADNIEISNFFELIVDLDICTKTRYVLNYLLFSNFASKFQLYENTQSVVVQ